MTEKEIEMVVNNLQWEKILVQTHKHMMRLASMLIRGCEVALRDEKQVQDFSDEVKKMQEEIATLTNATRAINEILKGIFSEHMKGIGIDEISREIVLGHYVERQNFKTLSQKFYLPKAIIKELYDNAIEKLNTRRAANGIEIVRGTKVADDSSKTD